MPRVTVFCGSGLPESTKIVDETRALGALLGELGLGLVYGGASVGLMGIVADAVLACGDRSEVIGILPRKLQSREVGHAHLARLEIVDTMAERKDRLLALGDAFVALPGGYGTLDELFEVLTMMQVGYFAKPTFVVNIDGYFDGLVQFVERAVDEKLLRAEHRRLFVTVPNVAALRPHLALLT